VNFTKFTTLVH